MFVVIARIKAKEGKGEALEALCKEMVEWVIENESNTLTYTCNRAINDHSRFAFFERYTNDKAFEAHTRSEKFVETTGRMQGLLDGPIEIQTYEEVAGKL